LTVQNLILFVTGRKGSGKTTLALRIAGDVERVIALDTLGQFGAEHGYEVAFGLEDCVALLLETRERDRFRVSCRCDAVEDMLKLARLCYELPRQLVIVEEASFYCSPHFLPDELGRLIRYGRHREIDQLYIARRPFEIHRDVTAQADVGISFVQHEPNDVRYLRAVAGPGAERVSSLKPFRALVWGEIGRAPLAAIEAADVVLDRERRYDVVSESPAEPSPAGIVTPAPDGAP